MTVISAPSALIGDATRGPAAVVVDGGRIVEVLHDVRTRDVDHVRLTSGVLTAGLLDLQVNGCFGVDFGDALPPAWRQARHALLATGVTSFLPTLITAPVPDLVARIDACAGMVGDDQAEASRILGLHVEGPFLSVLHAGAHDASLLRDPEPDQVEALLAAGRDGVLALVTLAPERRGALEAIRRLVAAGVVVSVGHTDATAALVHSAAAAGASMVTHLFNAQRGLHHREPGVPGAGLTDPRLRLGLIVDGHHVADDAVRVAFAAAGARIVLVTDAVAAAGMGPGTTTLGSDVVSVAAAGQPPRRRDGTLAGSALTLDEAVRNVVALGVGRDAALLAATRTPADAVGRQDLGRLEVGAVADLVWWDDDLHVRGVWLGGVRVA